MNGGKVAPKLGENGIFPNSAMPACLRQLAHEAPRSPSLSFTLSLTHEALQHFRMISYLISHGGQDALALFSHV